MLLPARDVRGAGARSPPEPARGAASGRPGRRHLRGDGRRSSARWSGRWPRSRPGRSSTPRSGPPRRSPMGRFLGAPACSSRSRLPGTRARRGHASRGSCPAGRWSRRSGWARRRSSCCSTTTPGRRTQRTRNGFSRGSRQRPSGPTSRCSSSRWATTRTRAAGSAARRVGHAWWRRRVRLTRIGGTVLKAEFPFDAGVTDERAWDEACRELDAASALPWVLLSGGVDEGTFARQVAVACRAGASGVLVGRSVWAPAATLAPAERDAWLLAEGRARLAALARLADELGTPWHARPNALAAAAPPGEGWYREY